MANNDNNNNSSSLNVGDIGMIRNILMGEQINNFEQRFQQMQDSMGELEQKLNAKIAELDEATRQSFEKSNQENDIKFADIEKQILSNVEKLNQRIDKVSKNDKARLGKMLEKVSKQLIGE